MNPFIQQLINSKINSLTPSELMKHGRNYNITLSTIEASKIIHILKSEPYIYIDDDQQHKRIIKKIATEIDPILAKKANELLNQYKKML